MSEYLKEAEQEFSGQGNNNNQQSSGQDSNQQQGNTSEQSSNSSSGGFMSQAETVGKDAMVDQEINSFATKEGIPAGADGFIDTEVNKEVNNFI